MTRGQARRLLHRIRFGTVMLIGMTVLFAVMFGSSPLPGITGGVALFGVFVSIYGTSEISDMSDTPSHDLREWAVKVYPELR